MICDMCQTRLNFIVRKVMIHRRSNVQDNQRLSKEKAKKCKAKPVPEMNNLKVFIHYYFLLLTAAGEKKR